MEGLLAIQGGEQDAQCLERGLDQGCPWWTWLIQRVLRNKGQLWGVHNLREDIRAPQRHRDVRLVLMLPWKTEGCTLLFVAYTKESTRGQWNGCSKCTSGFDAADGSREHQDLLATSCGTLFWLGQQIMGCSAMSAFRFQASSDNIGQKGRIPARRRSIASGSSNRKASRIEPAPWTNTTLQRGLSRCCEAWLLMDGSGSDSLPGRGFSKKGIGETSWGSFTWCALPGPGACWRSSLWDAGLLLSGLGQWELCHEISHHEDESASPPDLGCNILPYGLCHNDTWGACSTMLCRGQERSRSHPSWSQKISQFMAGLVSGEALATSGDQTGLLDLHSQKGRSSSSFSSAYLWAYWMWWFDLRAAGQTPHSRRGQQSCRSYWRVPETTSAFCWREASISSGSKQTPRKEQGSRWSRSGGQKQDREGDAARESWKTCSSLCLSRHFGCNCGPFLVQVQKSGECQPALIPIFGGLLRFLGASTKASRSMGEVRLIYLSRIWAEKKSNMIQTCSSLGSQTSLIRKTGGT